ncbi:protein turtle homolog A isoform X6 [Phyllostomus discolor]|uniref:Protein turtle homolog A n=1 Tax=Phyllostomus discolor TaxID=89673 RepID=A0A7E6CWQ8_9CHIR|nr:protein turtle homolog A isoform X6 [Phyllostomus discolor]
MVWCLNLAILSLIISQGVDGRGNSEVVPVVGRAGESAVLGCDLLPPAGRPPLHVIEWLRFGFLLPIFIQFGLYSPRVDPDYVGRVRLQKGASLQIEGLRVEDQGWYECRVLFLDKHSPEDDSANGSWVFLMVNSPPQFLETPPQVLEVQELEPLTLRCVARGSPQPHVTWKLQGQDLGQGHGQMQDPQSSWCPPTTARSMPPRIFHWLARLRRTLLTSPIAGSRTVSMSSTLDPAQATAMPPETPLPIGMRGVIRCPVRANPPLLFVSWTKDGQALQLEKFPGWSQGPEGSLVIALGNEDVLGEYSCTPYNSLGTAGPSPVTRVLLKAPPAFLERPKEEYFQEVGRELLIPCSAQGDPPPIVSWAKVGRGLKGQAQVDSNSSLILRPLTKEAHGRWECIASNAVAQVATSTYVYVLGTSPHVVTNVSVVPLPKGANVSWEPGFDGGYLQRFSVWYTPLAKHPDRAHHDWVSLAVPVGAAHLLVPGLQPHCQYQFSVLAQNKLGSGPFSEIVLSAPEGLSTTPAAPRLPMTEMAPPLSPPRGLVAVRTPRGVLLHWDPPELVPQRLDGYILEGRQGAQGWEVLDRAVAGTEMQLLVPGLIKDVLYEFRLVALAGGYVSNPSNLANVSTSGLEVYPSRTQLPGLLPQPVLAGVLGGLCFLGAAVLVSILAACLTSQRRAVRHRHRKHLRQDLPLIFSPPRLSAPLSVPGSGSPDSVAKLKLQASPVPSMCQSLLCGEPTRPPSSPPDPSPSWGPLPLEPICRGPDGRFVMGPNVGTSQERSGPEQVEPRTLAQCQTRPYDCSSSSSSPSGLPQPLCIADISPVEPSLASSPSPLPGAGPLLQYLSLPFFREMNVDGDWPPFEEPDSAVPSDYTDIQPCQTSPLLQPLDSPPGSPRAVLPGAVVCTGAVTEPAYTALADWTLRERLLSSLVPGAPRGSLTSQSSGRGSASFFRPPSTAPSAGGSYLSPTPGDTSSWASGPERWPRRDHVVTVSKRRNTSVDENYEWDSEFTGDMELLETLYRGLAGPRPRLEAESELGAKTPEVGCLLNTAHTPGPEARCAALREEFLAFRRRQDATRARLPAYWQPVPHSEQATLL